MSKTVNSWDIIPRGLRVDLKVLQNEKQVVLYNVSV